MHWKKYCRVGGLGAWVWDMVTAKKREVRVVLFEKVTFQQMLNVYFLTNITTITKFRIYLDVILKFFSIQ